MKIILSCKLFIKTIIKDMQKRYLLFLFGCIPLRCVLVYLTKDASARYQYYLGFLMLCVGVGFWYIYLFNLRKTGVEVFGDKIWWNSLRPVHGTLFLIAAYCLVINRSLAWKVLTLDTSIGLLSFINHHSM